MLTFGYPTLAAKLTKDTPVAPDDLDDFDPGHYRNDERLDYAYVTFDRTKDPTHLAQVVVASRDKRYHAYIQLYEFVGSDKKLVFQRELTTPPTLANKTVVQTRVVNGKRCKFIITLSTKA